MMSSTDHQAENRREVEVIERALLAKLQAKYAPLPPPPRPPPRDLFDPAE